MKKQKKKKWFVKQFIVIAMLCFGLIAGIHVHNAMAVDTEESGDEGETSSYANPAQAQHAANLATAAASQPDENTAEALSAVQQAEADLAEAERNGTQEDIDIAQEALTGTQEAYADLISEKTGVVSEEIAGMRNAGMGWGQIANELGVHPGLLGLGHTKKEQGAKTQKGVDMAEVTEATERNTRSGWSKGHGSGLNAGVESTSKTQGGLAFGHANKGTKSGGKGNQGGISGASGLSGGKGNGNSGGNGGDSRGGPGNSNQGNNKGGNSKSDKGNNKGGNSGNGKGGGNDK